MPSKTKTEIRPVRISDSPRVTELCHQLGYSITEEQVIERLKNLEGRDDNVILLATTDDGTIIAFLQVHIVALLAEGNRAEIASLVVDESVRSPGIGKILVTKAEEWEADRGLNNVVVRSRIDRDRAHRFYKTLGYEDFKIQYVFRKEFQDSK